MGVAVLAVFGLNSNYRTDRVSPFLDERLHSISIRSLIVRTVLVNETFPLPIFSSSAFHSAPFLTGAWMMISGFVNDNFSNRARISSSVIDDMLGMVLSERATCAGSFV